MILPLDPEVQSTLSASSLICFILSPIDLLRDSAVPLIVLFFSFQAWLVKSLLSRSTH